MLYQTFPPHPDLAAVVKCYWTLEVPAELKAPRQRVVPDGCIEMAFLLADGIRRYTSRTAYILQPRAMVLGQITKPLYIQPVGRVDTFAIRFYPYGFANFITTPLKELSDRETPLAKLFGKKVADDLQRQIIRASGTKARIRIIERFLLRMLRRRQTIDALVKSTVDTLTQTRGKRTAAEITAAQRRQLERRFSKVVGTGPKQIGRIVRLQAALRLMLRGRETKLTRVAYESEYYDQAHFIRDFKALTGTTPAAFRTDRKMLLSSVIYREG